MHRSIHDDRHLKQYIIDRVFKGSSMGVVLINLGQSKAFDKVNHQ